MRHSGSCQGSDRQLTALAVLLKNPRVAPYYVGNGLKMLMYCLVHCAFSHIAALSGIRRRLFQQPARIVAVPRRPLDAAHPIAVVNKDCLSHCSPSSRDPARQTVEGRRQLTREAINLKATTQNSSLRGVAQETTPLTVHTDDQRPPHARPHRRSHAFTPRRCQAY